MPIPLRRARAAIAAAACAVLVLAGCGDDGGEAAPTTTAAATTPTPAGPVTPATATEAATPTPTADVAAFVVVVRASLPEIAADRSDEEIGALAEQACTGLAEDLPADDVVAQMRSLGTLDAEATDEATARELVKLAIDQVCLDQADRVDEF